MRYVLSHQHDPVGLQMRLTGRGGLVAYLGTNDLKQVDEAIDAYLVSGEDRSGLDGKKCIEVIQALCYKVAKEIAALAAVVSGELDAVVLTGGLAFSQRVVNDIKRRVSFLGPVLIFPGENELEALASGVMSVLRGEEQLKEYRG